jgi:hypothetical protein
MPNDPAKEAFTPAQVPPEGLETPYGYLYRPLTDGKQIISSSRSQHLPADPHLDG